MSEQAPQYAKLTVRFRTEIQIGPRQERTAQTAVLRVLGPPEHDTFPDLALAQPSCMFCAGAFLQVRSRPLLNGEARSLQIVPLKEDEMPKLSAKATECICPACDGTGLKAVRQPAQPGRRIYPARCERCDGKGRTPNPK